MTDNIITGVFDSGVGGLSILKELLPLGGKFIYFGDTLHLPYGNKTKEEIINFGRSTMNFFISKNVKRVVMACNTSSALAYDTLKEEFKNKLEIHPLIQTVAPFIAKKGDVIGVMATEGTIKSGAYSKEIKKADSKKIVYELACPKFVEIVENRKYHDKESIEYIKSYLNILLEKKCDKIVLGCTHYPYLLPILSEFADKTMFINPAEFMRGIVPPANNRAEVEFYVSKDPETFKANAKLFMEISDTINLVNTSEVYV